MKPEPFSLIMGCGKEKEYNAFDFSKYNLATTKKKKWLLQTYAHTRLRARANMSRKCLNVGLCALPNNKPRPPPSGRTGTVAS